MFLLICEQMLFHYTFFNIIIDTKDQKLNSMDTDNSGGYNKSIDTCKKLDINNSCISIGYNNL